MQSDQIMSLSFSLILKKNKLADIKHYHSFEIIIRTIVFYGPYHEDLQLAVNLLNGLRLSFF